MRQERYGTFWRRIHSRARRERLPLRVMFEVTYRCNFRCAHCYVPESYRSSYRSRELGTDGVYDVLSQLKDAGCLFLGITGGEPLVRGDIVDILKYARRLGLETILYTNGSLIDKKTADTLAGLGLNKIDITVPAMSERAFRKITGIAGARDRVFNAIKDLRERGVSLGLKCCVLKENEAEIDEIRRFAGSIGCPLRLDGRLSPRLDGSLEPFGYGLREPAAGLRAPGQKDYIISECGAGVSQAAVTPAGEIKRCIMIDHPKVDISGGLFKKVWESGALSGGAMDARELCKCGLA